METWIAVLDEKALNCGHSRRCGVDYILFHAENEEDARTKAREFWMGPDFLNGNWETPRCGGAECSVPLMYLARSLEKCPVPAWEEEAKQLQESRAAILEEKQELAELKRLQEKYKDKLERDPL